MEFKKRDIKIYIISGKACSGKNVVATMIKDILKDKKVINLAFASYLKIYAKNIINWDGNEDNKPREFLQQLGVELIKNNIDNKLLINRIIEDIKVYSYFFDVITISDARFIDEIESIKNTFDDVKVIHVIGKDNNLTDEEKNHISEMALDNYHQYDYEIRNDSNLEELYKNITKIMEV